MIKLNRFRKAQLKEEELALLIILKFDLNNCQSGLQNYGIFDVINN